MAHDLGAKALLLEKAPEGKHGGNTRIAAQGYLNTSSAEKAAQYLTALCGPYTVPDEKLKTRVPLNGTWRPMAVPCTWCSMKR